MPSRKATDGEYRDIAHPINSATRDRIQTIILDNVIPIEDAVTYLKEGIEKTYKKKGPAVVDMNCQAVDYGVREIHQVEIPESWLEAEDPRERPLDIPVFVENLMIPMNKQEGDDLPVSAFEQVVDGTFPSGTSKYEKRGVAIYLPKWDAEKCIQCNQCAFVCPHSAIRPVLLTTEEKETAPQDFVTKPAIGKELQGLSYRMQTTPILPKEGASVG